MATLEYVKAKGVEVRFHGRGKNEASHYCGQCEVCIKRPYKKTFKQTKKILIEFN